MYKYPGARNAVNLSSTVLYNTAFKQLFFFFFFAPRLCCWSVFNTYVKLYTWTFVKLVIMLTIFFFPHLSPVLMRWMHKNNEHVSSWIYALFKKCFILYRHTGGLILCVFHNKASIWTWCYTHKFLVQWLFYLFFIQIFKPQSKKL